ncbi:MAG: carboxylating nicotinate-nucleotide diphosphorylase [Terriglobia bacterium]
MARQSRDFTRTETSFDAASHRRLLEQFLVEDLGADDLTTIATVQPERQAEGRFMAKSPMVLAGIDIAFEVFRLLDHNLAATTPWRDGDALNPGDVPGSLRGRARALLSGERVALNLLQHLSGIATLTRKYVDAVAGTAAKILDTRKTTPGLRVFEKYAVRVGGGANHRSSLNDAILIKENHVRMAGGIGLAISAARAQRSRARFLEVEVTTLEELDEALKGSPEIILLDNMTPQAVGEAARVAQARKSGILLEASGGITLESVRLYAEAGVDWISVGALTHSAPAADLSLEVEPLKN